MSLYGNFLRETEEIDIVETDQGYATYKIFPDASECYIIDIYVLPQYRRTKVASELANEVARKAKLKGCKFLTGTVIPTNNKSTESMKTLLGYGFSLMKSEVNKVWFVKELGDE
jgi:ribosomal protein S18 acetylase RimI-like enzyme